VNADISLVAERPKLAPHYPMIRKSIANRMKVDETKISIKSTTAEKLGWVGQGKGMAATAVVLLCSERS